MSTYAEFATQLDRIKESLLDLERLAIQHPGEFQASIARVDDIERAVVAALAVYTVHPGTGLL